VQSQCWNKKKENEHYPKVREKIQGKCSQFFFVNLKPFAEPWAIGVPRDQGHNPIKQGKKDPNGEGPQENVSEENDFFPFHGSSLISNGGIDARLSGLRNLREFEMSMDQLRACESAK
jgi:hypothetical protein